MSFLSVVCFQVEVSATGRSLINRNTMECGVPSCEWPRNLTNEAA